MLRPEQERPEPQQPRHEDPGGPAWSDEELRALRAMRRDVEPGAGLEDRTVARLRHEGLIHDGPDPAAREPWWTRLRWQGLLVGLTPPRLGWAAAALACVAAVFLAGVATGQRWALRSTADALATFHQGAMMQASARVQQTGSAYVEALVALGQIAADDSDAQDVSQGREAAVAALYAAASQLARLDPNDPVATRILQGLDDIRTADSADSNETRDDERQVLWF